MLDTDNDGRINYGEFRHFVVLLPGKRQRLVGCLLEQLCRPTLSIALSSLMPIS